MICELPSCQLSMLEEANIDRFLNITGFVDWTFVSMENRYCPNGPTEITHNITLRNPAIFGLASRAASDYLWDNNVGGFIAGLLWPVIFVMLIFVLYVAFTIVNRYKLIPSINRSIPRHVGFLVAGVAAIASIIFGILNVVKIAESELDQTTCNIFNALNQAINGREGYFSGLYPATMGLNKTLEWLSDSNILKAGVHQDLLKLDSLQYAAPLLGDIGALASASSVLACKDCPGHSTAEATKNAVLAKNPLLSGVFFHAMYAKDVYEAINATIDQPGALAAELVEETRSHVRLIQDNYGTDMSAVTLTDKKPFQLLAGPVSNAEAAGVPPTVQKDGEDGEDDKLYEYQYFAKHILANITHEVAAYNNSIWEIEAGEVTLASSGSFVQMTKPAVENADFFNRVRVGMERMDRIHFHVDDTIRAVDRVNLTVIDNARVFIGAFAPVFTMVAVLAALGFMLANRNEKALTRGDKACVRISSRFVMGSAIFVMLLNIIFSLYGHALGSICGELTDDSDDVSVYERVNDLAQFEPEDKGIMWTCLDEQSHGHIWRTLDIEDETRGAVRAYVVLEKLGIAAAGYQANTANYFTVLSQQLGVPTRPPVVTGDSLLPFLRNTLAYDKAFVTANLPIGLELWTTSDISTADYMPAASYQLVSYSHGWGLLALYRKAIHDTAAVVATPADVAFFKSIFPKEYALTVAHLSTTITNPADIAAEMQKRVETALVRSDVMALLRGVESKPLTPGVSLSYLDALAVKYVTSNELTLRSIFDLTSYLPRLGARVPGVLGSLIKISQNPRCNYLNTMLRNVVDELCHDAAAPSLELTVYQTLFSLAVVVFWYVANQFYKQNTHCVPGNKLWKLGRDEDWQAAGITPASRAPPAVAESEAPPALAATVA